MALIDNKITDNDVNVKGVVAAPDRMLGTADENKRVFDRLIREAVKGKLNQLIDNLRELGVEHIIRSVDGDGHITYLRVGVDGLVETSTDGINWGTTALKALAEQVHADAESAESAKDRAVTAETAAGRSQYYAEQAALRTSEDYRVTDLAKGQAESARDKARDEADRAEREADRARDEADRAGTNSGNAKDEADRAGREADRARNEANRAEKAAGEAAEDAAAKVKQQTEDAAAAAASSAGAAEIEAERAESEADRAKDEADRAGVAAAEAVQSEVDRATAAEGALSAGINDEKLRNDKQDARLANLEAAAQGKLYREEVDDTEAYTKTVPAGALPYAAVTSIGGKTMKWNQLVITSDYDNTSYGVKISRRNGLTTLSGTKTGSNRLQLASAVPAVVGHKYYLRKKNYYLGDGNTCNFYFLNNDTGNATGYQSNATAATKDDISVIYKAVASYFVFSTITTQNVVCDITMGISIIDLTDIFGEGNEPTTTEDPRIEWIERIAEARPQYDEDGAIEYEPEEVVSHGVNLLYGINLYGSKAVSSTDGTLTNSNTRYSGYVNVSAFRGKTITYSWKTTSTLSRGMAFYDENKVFVLGKKISDGATVTVPDNAVYARFTFAVEEAEAIPMVVLGDSIPDQNVPPRDPDSFPVGDFPMYVPVEKGGYLSFENDKGEMIPLPSSVTYAINVQEAINNE